MKPYHCNWTLGKALAASQNIRLGRATLSQRHRQNSLYSTKPRNYLKSGVSFNLGLNELADVLHKYAALKIHRLYQRVPLFNQYPTRPACRGSGLKSRDLVMWGDDRFFLAGYVFP
jgi:hypothetical protein